MSKDDFPDSGREERKELGITMKREGGEKKVKWRRRLEAEARVTHEGRKEAMR